MSHTHEIANAGHSHSIADAGHSHGITTPAAIPNPNAITLDTPIVRGEQTITEITLRKPKAGELRGTSLNALVNLDVDALGKVLPRIASPMLTEFDVRDLDPSDLVQLGVAFADFLLPNRAR
ncbi:phage tail assembly protein [Paraburkholderia sediminicola]|uniref:phage tail assembly protein n=1 Tax=Paraburkholderia sediminicola TaxID=458836 RepID=UPI0038BD4F57